MTLFAITLVLFLIMDPIGNISSFINVLKDEPLQRKRMIILREMSIALFAMLLFNLIGEFLFNFLGISEITVRLSSGIILFLVAIEIIFPKVNSIRNNLPKVKPFIIPLAIPLIAGPSLLATIILYTHMESSQQLMIAAIGISWVIATSIMLLAPELYRFFGVNGLAALERLMGMILILLAIQRFMEGVQLFIASI